MFEQLAEAQKALIAIAVTKVDDPADAYGDIMAIKEEAAKALHATGYDEDMLAILGIKIGLNVTGNAEA